MVQSAQYFIFNSEIHIFTDNPSAYIWNLRYYPRFIDVFYTQSEYYTNTHWEYYLTQSLRQIILLRLQNAINRPAASVFIY